MMKDADNRLVVVVPTFNRREVTAACVQKLLANESAEFSIFICDSHSTDGTQEALKGIDRVEVIDVGAKAWWSSAVNQGVKKALEEGFQNILIINDDIDFDGNLIAALSEKSRCNPSRIISASQLTRGGVFLGIKYLGLFKELKTLWIPPHNEEMDVQTSNGCCLFIPSEIFRRIGLFNERFCPHQYGDSEFQIRAWHSGFPTLSTPAIRIEQLGSTDYYRRIKLRNLLSFEGSPVHFTGYLFFGRALFQSWLLFFLFGARFHFSYFKSLVKALIFLSNRYFREIKSK
jgi:GT2 family glycosyltransferase